MNLDLFNYKESSNKAKETYNYQKIVGVFADYGYECVWLNNDTFGADFLANHQDHTLRIQLKTRLTFDKKYIENDLWIVYIDKDDVIMYKHDELLLQIPEALEYMYKNNTETWSTAATNKKREILKGSQHVKYIGKIQRCESVIKDK